MTTSAELAPQLALPWESSVDEDRFFRRIMRNLFSAFIAFALMIPFLPLQEASREKQEALPPHLARVILEQQQLPKVPPKPEPKAVVKQEKVPKPEPRREAPSEPVQDAMPKPVDKITQAREQAAVSGVLAFQDELMAMRDSVDASTLDQTQLSRGQSSAAAVERALVSSREAVSSGGVRSGSVSMNSGGAALSAPEASSVQSSIAGAGSDKASSVSDRMGGRRDESIRRVMDRNKGGIFTLYHRALRKDPLLEGKLVFEMLIQPSGEISEVTLLSSGLADEALTRKLLARIRMIRFEAEQVEPTRVNYSFAFLPS